MILVVVAIVAGLGIWIWAAADDESAGPERGVTVENVANEDAFDDDGFADALVGQQVTVSGNVSEVVDTRAIRLGGDDFGGDGLLVIQVSSAGAQITEDDEVRVTGTVREYDEAAFATEFGPEFDDDVYEPWFDENVLVATNLTQLNQNSSG